MMFNNFLVKTKIYFSYPQLMLEFLHQAKVLHHLQINNNVNKTVHNVQQFVINNYQIICVVNNLRCTLQQHQEWHRRIPSIEGYQ